MKKLIDFNGKLFLTSQNYCKSNCLLASINTLEKRRKLKGVYSSNKILESAWRLERRQTPSFTSIHFTHSLPTQFYVYVILSWERPVNHFKQFTEFRSISSTRCFFN